MKQINFKRIFNKSIPYLFLFAISFLIIAPKLFDGVFNLGADGQFHSSIILGYQQIIRSGNWDYNGIIPTIGMNLGYGTPLFYQTLPHLIAAFISFIIPSENSVFWSMDVMYWLNYFVSGITFYLLAKALFKNKLISVFSACLYMIAPYHLSQVYTSDAFSQIWSYAFLPLVFLGVYYLINQDRKRFFIYFTVGMSLCMYSHLMTTFFIGILTSIPVILVYFKRIFNKENIKWIILSVILIILITSPITANLSYLKTYGNYQVFLEGHMELSGFENTLQNPLGFVFYRFAKNNYLDNMSINILALLGCILIVILVLLNKINKEDIKRVLFILITTLLTYFLLCKYSPLRLISEQIAIIQFATRLFPPAIMGTSLLAGYALKYLNVKKVFKMCIIVMTCICGVLQIRYIPYGYESGKTIGLVTAKINDFNVMLMPSPYDLTVIGSYVSFGSQREYLPADYDIYDFRARRDEGIINLDNNGDIDFETNEIPELTFSATNVVDKTTVEFPRIYYPGYKLENIYTDEVIEVSKSKIGLLEAEVSDGNYKLSFEGNPWWIISRYLRIVGIIVFILVLMLFNKKGKNEKVD